MLPLTLPALAHSRLLAGSLSLSLLSLLPALPLALTRLLSLSLLSLAGLLTLPALLARVLTWLLAALTRLLAPLAGSALAIFAFTFAAAAGGFLELPAHVFQAGERALEPLVFAATACLSEALGLAQLVTQAIDRFGHRPFTLRDVGGVPLADIAGGPLQAHSQF